MLCFTLMCDIVKLKTSVCLFIRKREEMGQLSATFEQANLELYDWLIHEATTQKSLILGG